MSYRLDRFELKFVITREQRDRLLPHLLPHLRADQNAGEGAFYPIVTLYYDNADRDCYWEKVRGARSRRKLRVRTYGSRDGSLPATTFVEIKQKCEGRVVKRRIRLSLADALRVAAGEVIESPQSPWEQRTLDETRQLVQERGFRPCCCLRYERQAFADNDPGSDLRVTFDSGIAYRFDQLTARPDDRDFQRTLLADGFSVMEVKVTGAVPYWLTRMLGEQGCILQSHSKYCHVLEAGDPVLRGMLFGGPQRFGMPALAANGESAAA
ncbi:MAG: hypothetical protein QOE70_2145 [Chthoniobacter sp.]|nr:hypothetical protein [Chthoniobacter sp.]